jgi:hypothetical protein
MPYCAEYCLDMPAEFPAEEFGRFMAAARRVLLSPSMSPAWQEFAGASNLIGWRFRASSEDWQFHRQSLVSHTNPNHEELYRRERALFGMFTSGVASLESTVYAIAALCSHPAVLSFPFGPEEQRACSPRRLIEWLRPYPGAASLVGHITVFVSSNEWSLWMGLRNRMTHRSNLPRIVYGAAGAPAPATNPLVFAATSSTPHVNADTTDFDALHAWLAKTIRLLLVEGSNLTNGP